MSCRNRMARAKRASVPSAVKIDIFQDGGRAVGQIQPFGPNGDIRFNIRGMQHFPTIQIDWELLFRLHDSGMTLRKLILFTVRNQSPSHRFVPSCDKGREDNEIWKACSWSDRIGGRICADTGKFAANPAGYRASKTLRSHAFISASGTRSGGEKTASSAVLTGRQRNIH